MKTISPVLLGLSLAVASSSLAAAQETPAPPKVLQLTREFIKPGKAGAIHDKSESNFVEAMARAKWPTHYIALNSLSGKSRALYLTGYDSFDAWQKDYEATMKNAALSAAIERASVADGELLDGFDQAVFYYQDDLSYRASADIAHARFFEVISFHIKPGHGKEFSDLVKMAIETNKKAGTDAHWAMYELEYGGDDGYVFLSADKSLGEIDSAFADAKKFHDALGDEGAKKFHELIQASIESSDSELFAINPRQSYPRDEWVKADPEFWKPKPIAAAKPMAESKKPAQ